MSNSKHRIIRIVSDTKVIINIGSNDGVQVRDVFKIMGQGGSKVIDPFTKEDLGTLTVEKGYIRVLQVFPKMSLCVNNEASQFLNNALRAVSAIDIAIQKTLFIPPLNVNPNDITAEIIPDDMVIRIGDLVEKVIMSSTVNSPPEGNVEQEE